MNRCCPSLSARDSLKRVEKQGFLYSPTSAVFTNISLLLQVGERSGKDVDLCPWIATHPHLLVTFHDHLLLDHLLTDAGRSSTGRSRVTDVRSRGWW